MFGRLKKTEIRRARPDEYQTIIENEKLLFDTDVVELADFYLYSTYVLLKNDSIIGHYMWYSEGNDAYLFTLAINKEHQSKGFSDTLLNHFFDETKEYSHALHVDVDNIPAICLYRKHGFKEIKIEEGFYQSGKSAIYMRKEK